MKLTNVGVIQHIKALITRNVRQEQEKKLVSNKKKRILKNYLEIAAFLNPVLTINKLMIIQT